MKSILLGVLAILAVTATLASAKPLQVSVTPDIALYDRDVPIEGLTLSIWGENPQKGLALGLVNGSTGNSAGISLGVLLNYAENYKGFQLAPVNYTTGEMKGLQVGVVNIAGNLKGLQLGVVNYAEDAGPGIQIGLINIIRSNTRWFSGLPDEVAPAMILVNWRF